MSKNWFVYLKPREVIPQEDLMAHSRGLACACEPRLDGDVIVHHAFDLREDDERCGKKDGLPSTELFALDANSSAQV